MNIVALIRRSVGWNGTLAVAGLALLAQGCAVSPEEGDDLEDTEDMADALRNAPCPKKATAGDYVVCVKTSKWGAETITIYDRKGAVAHKGDATTSQRDDDGTAASNDTITCKGRHKILSYSAKTPTLKLEDFFHYGCGQQGIHYYGSVAATYDSHGCVRVKRATSNWMKENIAPLIFGGDGAIYVHIE